MPDSYFQFLAKNLVIERMWCGPLLNYSEEIIQMRSGANRANQTY